MFKAGLFLSYLKKRTSSFDVISAHVISFFTLDRDGSRAGSGRRARLRGPCFTELSAAEFALAPTLSRGVGWRRCAPNAAVSEPFLSRCEASELDFSSESCHESGRQRVRPQHLAVVGQHAGLYPAGVT